MHRSLIQLRAVFVFLARKIHDPSTQKAFVVTCRNCRRDVPIGMKEFPFHSFTIECSLCGDKQRYRPSDVIFGRAHPLVQEQEKLALQTLTDGARVTGVDRSTSPTRVIDGPRDPKIAIR